MIEVIITILIILGIVVFIYVRYDPLSKYEPISEEEMLLLTLVDEEFFPHLLEYVRTLRMSIELQDHLKDRKESLESISYFMLVQAARSEQEKKDRWEKDRSSRKNESLLSHNERMILQRLKRWMRPT